MTHRPATLLEELRVEAALVPNRRGELYAEAANEIERLSAPQASPDPLAAQQRAETPQASPEPSDADKRNIAVALMILRNDRAEAVKWARDLLLPEDGYVVANDLWTKAYTEGYADSSANRAPSAQAKGAAQPDPADPSFHSTERDGEAMLRPVGEQMAWAEGFNAGAEDWIPIGDDKNMPRAHQMVALVDVRRWANVGEPDWGCNVYACGYWESSLNGYWSVHGERAISKDAFTHWIPLPSAPTEPSTRSEHD